MRRALAGLLVALAMVAALGAEGAWLAGRALEPDRFADATAAALRAPEGRDALVAQLQDVARARAGRALPQAALESAVRRATEDPRLAPALASVAAAGREGLLADGDGSVALGPLRPALVEAARSVDPGLAAAIPPPEALGAIELPAPGSPLPRSEWVDELPRAAVLAAIVAAALLTLALMASPRRAATARAAGYALVVAAALPALARLAAPPVAERVADGTALAPLAGRLSAELLAEWWIPAAVCAGAGVLLVLAGGALSPRAPAGRPARRRAA